MGYETHGPKEWVQTLNEIVGDTPVVFENSYRRAPMYAFYSGKPAFSLNNINYRQNQYAIDSSEFAFQNKRIAFVTPYASSGEFSYVPFRTNRYFGWYIDNFESFRKLRCFVDTEPIELTSKEQRLEVYNPYQRDISLDKLKFSVAYLDRYRDIIEIDSLSIEPVVANTKFLKAQDTTRLYFSFPKPKKMQPKFIKFSISENGLPSGINSPSIKVKP